MSPYAKFGLDRPSRSAGRRQHTDRQADKHIAFYMLDLQLQCVQKKNTQARFLLYLRGVENV